MENAGCVIGSLVIVLVVVVVLLLIIITPEPAPTPVPSPVPKSYQDISATWQSLAQAVRAGDIETGKQLVTELEKYRAKIDQAGDDKELICLWCLVHLPDAAGEHSITEQCREYLLAGGE